jgi:hypothetical protein
VKTRLIFWIIAVPLWGVSGLFALLSLLSMLDAPNVAAKNQAQRAALLRRGELVGRYLKANGRLPSKEEFAKASTNLNDGSIYQYELSTSRPEAGEGFKFPQWPEGKQNFAIWYWRGEWSEFYDSNSRSTTLDETSKSSCWIKNALWPLGVSLIAGAPPFVAFSIWRKHLTRHILWTPR